jgi:hydrogenase maturation protein HypF
VVLAGGCFLNQILTRGVAARLTALGLRVHLAHRLPPNDGGIALGQAWVGLQRGAK